MQQHDAFQYWQRERDAVEGEMIALLAAGQPASPEERQVRQIQFQALIERREAAARDLLQSDRALRHSKSPATQTETADHSRQGESSEPIAAVPAQGRAESVPPLEPAK